MILVEQLRIPEEAVRGSSLDTPLLGRGIGLDSIESLALVTELEQQFEIRVDDRDMKVALFDTLGTISQFVLNQIHTQRTNDARD